MNAAAHAVLPRALAGELALLFAASRLAESDWEAEEHALVLAEARRMAGEIPAGPLYGPWRRLLGMRLDELARAIEAARRGVDGEPDWREVTRARERLARVVASCEREAFRAAFGRWAGERWPDLPPFAAVGVAREARA